MLEVRDIGEKYMERLIWPWLRWDCDNDEHCSNKETVQDAGLRDGGDMAIDLVWDCDGM